MPTEFFSVGAIHQVTSNNQAVYIYVIFEAIRYIICVAHQKNCMNSSSVSVNKQWICCITERNYLHENSKLILPEVLSLSPAALYPPSDLAPVPF